MIQVWRGPPRRFQLITTMLSAASALRTPVKVFQDDEATLSGDLSKLALKPGSGRRRALGKVDGNTPKSLQGSARKSQQPQLEPILGTASSAEKPAAAAPAKSAFEIFQVR